MTIILGIDPGSRFTGYGVIKQDKQQFTYLGSGCIKAMSQGEDLASRLQTIFAGGNTGLVYIRISYYPRSTEWTADLGAAFFGVCHRQTF